MASPFVPVPMPMPKERGLRGGGASKPRRAQRASSLGCVSGSATESSMSSSTSSVSGVPRGSRQDRGRTEPEGRGSRSRTPPATHSPAPQARVNGGCLEASVEYSTCPRSASDPEGARPVAPTLLGYEVMEERAKFTVYKVLVKKSHEESWVVFRRYTDFSRLNDKLKEMFPGFRLCLPPKRWFKDNYEADFLEARQRGLQVFLENLVAHKDIANCFPVREFLCFDDPPGPFDSLEESRAFCETLEESNYRLQKEVQEKQKEIEALRRRLREQEALLLERGVRAVQIHSVGASPESHMESSSTEADQGLTQERGGLCRVLPLRSSACLCGPPLGNSPPAVRVPWPGRQPSEQ
ncbi:sorting nexin-16 isoform X1 [Gadus chalcogrammus]|uniref:sorting nexin-16 isoform X1 n=1 Tax=Gadus chalcogrammus TaxID=1042646 RepID=UPI0024C4AD5F|nr:sorting nexin-16 isoform X1 [Gadus chalcogrammus]